MKSLSQIFRPIKPRDRHFTSSPTFASLKPTHLYRPRPTAHLFQPETHQYSQLRFQATSPPPFPSRAVAQSLNNVLWFICTTISLRVLCTLWGLVWLYSCSVHSQRPGVVVFVFAYHTIWSCSRKTWLDSVTRRLLCGHSALLALAQGAMGDGKPWAPGVRLSPVFAT